MSGLSIGSIAAASASARGSATALRAREQRLQQQYRDCVTCWTAKTLDGQVQIASIRQALTTIESQLASGAAAAQDVASTAPTGARGTRLDAYA